MGPLENPGPPKARVRVSQTALKLYSETIKYFKEMITATANIINLPPQAVVQSLALELLDEVPQPCIEDVEWNFSTWPNHNA